ncbi:MAG: hypothetical protein Q8K07_11070 [Methylicorpusculum sp.]|uniref:hypothetical protein n=1 Tax=Methylicorpusculum sp. TaxID=2713644 RepID=UPI0027174278|nr:hypothetical protein [Methylicorpusculum sp.]MDO9241029.1 hypothetical protein [Methylicorpusculum sp.]MDP2202550.1 hypothetical protein [Methylicorpusculum sp.]
MGDPVALTKMVVGDLLQLRQLGLDGGWALQVVVNADISALSPLSQASYASSFSWPLSSHSVRLSTI